MNRKNQTLAITAIMLVALFVNAAPLPEGTPAPDAKLRTYFGPRIKLSKYEGKPVVLNFWASWCGPCRTELPDLVEASEAYGSEVVFIGAVVNSNRGDILSLVNRHKIRYPIGIADRKMVQEWNVSTLPATFVLDANHEVVWSTSSTVSASTLDWVIQNHVEVDDPSRSLGRS